MNRIKEKLKELRMWQWVILSAIALWFVMQLNGERWLTDMVNSAFQAFAGLVILYWAQRSLTHTRTHELNDTQRDDRENYLIIGAGIVIGCSMLS